MRERSLGLPRNVDFSLLEPLDQIIRREIDQLHGISAIEYRIGNSLAYANMRDLSDNVIEAFDMLDVDRRVDVNAAAQQLFDVEIALRMTAAWRVCVGKLIDQHD